ncbi:MAG: hypothetical protein ABI399_12115 [Bauldia sp.]
MRRLLVAAAAMVLAVAAIPALADSEPETIVRSIYQAYGPETEPDNPHDAYFSPKLLNLWKEVDEGGKGDVEYSIDFDVFLDAQDIDTVTDIVTKLTDDGPDKAHVDVTYTAFGEQRASTYDFISTDAGWKIDNIEWGADRDDLRKLLTQLRADQRKSR